MQKETRIYGDNGDLVRVVKDAGRTLVERADEIGGTANLTAELDINIRLRPDEVPEIKWSKKIMPYTYPETQQRGTESYMDADIPPVMPDEPEYETEE